MGDLESRGRHQANRQLRGRPLAFADARGNAGLERARSERRASSLERVVRKSRGLCLQQDNH